MAVSGGNVGIGTASPTDKLHVNGSMTVNAINLNGNTIQASTGNSVILKPGIASAYFAVATTAVTAYNFPELVLLGGTTTTLKLNSGNASIWNFNTNYAVNNNLTISPSLGGGNMIISGTNLGIGVTNPTTKLQVAGEISPGTDNAYPLGDASLRFTAVYAVNGTIQTSDERQKKEVQNSDLGLEFINQLRPVSYYWKSGSDSSLHYGLIAQETKIVIDGIKNGTKNSSMYDRSASLSTETIVTYDKKSDRYGIKYSELIAPIIKAVQELNSKVNSILEKMQESTDLASTKVDQEEFEKVKKESLDKDKKIESLQKEISEIKLYLCSKDAKSDLCL